MAADFDVDEEGFQLVVMTGPGGSQLSRARGEGGGWGDNRESQDVKCESFFKFCGHFPFLQISFPLSFFNLDKGNKTIFNFLFHLTFLEPNRPFVISSRLNDLRLQYDD